MLETLSSEKTTIGTLLLHMIRSIAEQYGGTIEKDVVTGAIDIWVPHGSLEHCSEEIHEHLGAVHDHIFTLAVAFFSGIESVCISRN